MEKNKKLIVACAVTAVIGIGGYFIYNKFYGDEYVSFEDEMVISNTIENSSSINIIDSNLADSKDSNNSKNSNEEEVIVIHVIGHVMNEGIVKIKEGSRVIDAIEAAGGATEDSDLSLINLAYILSDGEKIYVPGVNDNEDMDVSEFLNIGENRKELKVNINTANEAEFEKIPGIGASIAGKIVAYRNENGKFKSKEEIKNVSGIGESKYKNIENYLYIK